MYIHCRKKDDDIVIESDSESDEFTPVKPPRGRAAAKSNTSRTSQNTSRTSQNVSQNASRVSSRAKRGPRWSSSSEDEFSVPTFKRKR